MMTLTATRRIALTLVLSAACLAVATPARAEFNIIIGPGGIQIGGGGGGSKQPPQKKRYTVKLHRPRELGGGVVTSASGLTYQQALNAKARFEQRHWVIWKYAGIGKSYHSRAFSSYAGAKNFLKNKGPAKAANKLGIAIIAKQYIADGHVRMY